MKKIILIGFTIGLFLSQWGKVIFAYENEPNGFRRFKWRTPIDSLSNLKHKETVKRYGVIKYYTKKDEVLKLGDVKLMQIRYCFWQGKFYEVLIYTNGFKDWTALKDLVFAKFGEGDQPDKGIEEYIWNGAVTNLYLGLDETIDLGIFKMTSVEIERQMKEQLKQKAKEGAEDGF